MARGATWCMRMATRASLAVRPLIRAVSIHADQISANDDYLVGEIYLVIDCSLQCAELDTRRRSPRPRDRLCTIIDGACDCANVHLRVLDVRVVRICLVRLLYCDLCYIVPHARRTWHTILNSRTYRIDRALYRNSYSFHFRVSFRTDRRLPYRLVHGTRGHGPPRCPLLRHYS